MQRSDLLAIVLHVIPTNTPGVHIGRRHLPLGAHRWQTFDRAFYEPYLLRSGVGSGLTTPHTDRNRMSSQTLGVAHQ